MNREKKLITNMLIISLGTIMPQLASIVTLPIITGRLTKTELGTFDLINTLVSLLIPVLTMQIEAAAFRYLIDQRENTDESEEIISTVLTFILSVPIIPLVILFFALGNLNLSTKMLICTYFYLDVAVITLGQIVRGIDKNKEYSLSAVIRSLIRMIIIITAIEYNGMGLNGLLLAMSVSSAVGCLLLFIKGKIYSYYKPFLFSKSKLKQLLVYSLPMIPNCICLWVMNLSDRLLVTAFLGVEMVAVYSVANKIPNLFSIVQSTFTYAWQENASITSTDSDASEYYSSVFDTIFGILVGVMSLLIAATPLIYIILIRGDYPESYNQMPLLLMGIFFSTLNSFLGGIYVAIKKTKVVGITTVFGAVLNFLINISLIRFIGLYAASISTVISFLVLVLYRMKNIQKFQKMNYNWKKLSIYVLLLGAMCLLCFQQNIILNILNAAIAIVVVYALNKKIIKTILNKVFKH